MAGETFTRRTSRINGATSVWNPTITDLLLGEYEATYTAAEVGSFYWIGVGSMSGAEVRINWTVIAATADPAALATAIAGVQTTVDAQDAIWTSARAARLDRIGTGTVQVSSPSISDGTRLDFTRGDAYLNADGLAKSWTVDDVTVASATLYLRTFAGATVLSKAMTVSGTTVRVDITALETAAFSLGTPVYRYEIVAVLAGGSTATVARGDAWVVD